MTYIYICTLHCRYSKSENKLDSLVMKEEITYRNGNVKKKKSDFLKLLKFAEKLLSTTFTAVGPRRS